MAMRPPLFAAANFQPAWWHIATIVEALLGLGEIDRADRQLARIAISDVPDWQSHRGHRTLLEL